STTELRGPPSCAATTSATPYHRIYRDLPTHRVMADISKEGRMQLALEAYKKGLFPSKTAAAKAFDVPPRTFMTRVNGTTARKDSTANCRKLTDTEESTLSAWILDMDRRGLPPRIST
ncbi:hypothetical protein T310_10022, partial [Rasamsonia emersonii CBS 393.64]